MGKNSCNRCGKSKPPSQMGIAQVKKKGSNARQTVKLCITCAREIGTSV